MDREIVLLAIIKMRVVWKKYTFVFWMSFCPKAPSIWVVGISPSINRSLYVISDLITTKSGEFTLSLSHCDCSDQEAGRDVPAEVPQIPGRGGPGVRPGAPGDQETRRPDGRSAGLTGEQHGPLSLVEDNHCWALIGRELQSVEIISV